MPIVYVAIFFVCLILYKAFFITSMKYAIDSCVAHMENLEKNYPSFYSENRPSMTRFWGNRKILAEYSETGGVAIRIAMARVLFPIKRSDTAKAEYKLLKQDPIFKIFRRLLLLQMFVGLALVTTWWILGTNYLLGVGVGL